MIVRRKDGAIFVTGLESREINEIRKMSRPSITKAERRELLVGFLKKRRVKIAPTEEIYVWA